MEDIMELARSEAMLFKFGSGTGTDLSHAPLAPREALRRRQAVGPAVVHAGLRPDRGGRQERRQDPPGGQDAVDEGLAPRHHGVHRVQEPRGEEGPRADRSKGYEPQRGLRLDPLPERQPLGPPERRVHGGRRGRQALDHALGDRSEQGRAHAIRPARCSAAWPQAAWACGDPGVQYDTTINRWHTCPNSGRINASQPVLGVHVPRRHGLQPGEHQPDEVPPRRTARSTSSGSRRPAGWCSSPRRSWSITPAIPTQRIAANSHRFRPLGLGYSNLGSLIMASGAALRFGRGPRTVRRDHGPLARGGLPHQHRAGRRGRAVRRLRGEPRADAARHGDALGEGRADQELPEVSPGRRPASSGTKCSSAAAATASATPRPRCWPPPARSAS